jgi:hypothetical protein
MYIYVCVYMYIYILSSSITTMALHIDLKNTFEDKLG